VVEAWLPPRGLPRWGEQRDVVTISREGGARAGPEPEPWRARPVRGFKDPAGEAPLVPTYRDSDPRPLRPAGGAGC